jgi:ankyrin repeat protein
MLLVLGLALLAAGCGPKPPSKPLHTAVQEKDYGAVRHHIAARSDLNAKDKGGWTALHLAAKQGDAPMVQLLATAGADIGRTGPGGKTPLEVARESGHTAIVQFLETKLTAAPEKVAREQPQRRLIDGGLGVSDVLDAH